MLLVHLNPPKSNFKVLKDIFHSTQTMCLMQEHFHICVLHVSYFFSVTLVSTSVPSQIQQTLLTVQICHKWLVST